jgi:hypothetical protein
MSITPVRRGQFNQFRILTNTPPLEGFLTSMNPLLRYFPLPRTFTNKMKNGLVVQPHRREARPRMHSKLAQQPAQAMRAHVINKARPGASCKKITSPQFFNKTSSLPIRPRRKTSRTIAIAARPCDNSTSSLPIRPHRRPSRPTAARLLSASAAFTHGRHDRTSSLPIRPRRRPSSTIDRHRRTYSLPIRPRRRPSRTTGNAAQPCATYLRRISEPCIEEEEGGGADSSREGAGAFRGGRGADFVYATAAVAKETTAVTLLAMHSVGIGSSGPVPAAACVELTRHARPWGWQMGSLR